MTEEMEKEMRKRLATVAVARKELLEVAAWLEEHRDVKGSDPYLGPIDLAYYIKRACEQLSFAVGQFMAFVCPSGIPGDLAAKNAESVKEGK